MKSIYFSQDIIHQSLSKLEKINPFYGICFLVFKQGNLPVGEAVNFPADRNDDEFLKKYYHPDQQSNHFFRVFRGADKKKYWLSPDYASSGLQAVRTQTFRDTLLHESGSTQWGWKDNYLAVLKEKPKKQLLPAFYMAVWLYREEPWQENSTCEEVVRKFFSDFNINENEQGELFDASVPQNVQDCFADELFSWPKLVNALGIPDPPDSPPEEGAILSSLSLQEVGPAHSLQINLAERVNLFTGDNGLGKSFLLEIAYWTISGIWPGFQAYPRTNAAESAISFNLLGPSGKIKEHTSTYDWTRQHWQHKKSIRAGLLVYGRADGAFAVWDPAKDCWPDSEKKKIIFSREEIWEGLQDKTGGKTSYVANGLIADWVHWQNSPDKSAFEILRNVLKRLSPPDLTRGDLGILEPGQPVRISGDSRWMPTIKHPYGETPLAYASAGVRRIVALAYIIVWAWLEHKEQSKLMHRNPQKSMMILVDEIEAHLHPKWQRRILPSLLEVQKDLSSEELRVQLLAVTHSPLVMASAEPFFDSEKDAWFDLDLVENGDDQDHLVALSRRPLLRRGDASSWLTSEAFDMASARSAEAEQVLEDAAIALSDESFTAAQAGKLDAELRKVLGDTDPFWMRWRFIAEKKGWL
ncbi:MAG: AAA domain-containing protein, putative AbiEii toxin, Type IV TA system [Candidatus Electronema aureum]|uniref:AAA domain-containing protein, putative AbiEii toxin, Type IV TA system n=1 Tax=Candidatus Electronema aureum TaxID=2005002 RepID=A0A521FZC7_9BACT|nr:MAG: AAA domain-containing protein, putative AbiEii toxin, Type IV TA system [Candidatus Electronema aureum]